jgi:CheY-like chemotaxis protein
LDLRPPKSGWLEMMRRIREDKHMEMLAVVTLISSKEDGDVTAGHKVEANSYIRKPADSINPWRPSGNLGYTGS